MHLDVVDLQEFYLGPLGQTARRMIRRRIRLCWPDVSGLAVLGLGYAVPYLRQFRSEAARVLAFMPAGQGVSRWPGDGPSQTALTEDGMLPLPDESVERILLVHELENCPDTDEMLREVWRVLAPAGRVLIVAPNRRGLWARRETTPFGQGQPFSQRQLSRLLADAMLSPVRWASGLHIPPVEAGLVLRWASAWERLGDRWWPRFGGILLVEATKQIYAVRPRRLVRHPARESVSILPGLRPGGARVARLQHRGDQPRATMRPPPARPWRRAGFALRRKAAQLMNSARACGPAPGFRPAAPDENP
jgi:SAM-dependent methyltransferase